MSLHLQAETNTNTTKVSSLNCEKLAVFFKGNFLASLFPTNGHAYCLREKVYRDLNRSTTFAYLELGANEYLHEILDDFDTKRATDLITNAYSPFCTVLCKHASNTRS